MNKTKFAIFSILLFVFSYSNLFAAEEIIEDVYVVVNKEVKDARVIDNLYEKSNDKPVGGTTLKSLSVGSKFINEDGSARVVTAISEVDGVLMIETEKPEIEEIFDAVYVPDFDKKLTKENMVLARGVSWASGARDINAPKNLFEQMDATKKAQVSWIDSDSTPVVANNRDDILEVQFSTTLYKGSFDPGDQELAEKINKATAAYSSGNYSSYDGGADDPVANWGERTDTSYSVSGEVILDAALRFLPPQVKGGLLKPSVNVEWCTKYLIPFPIFHFEKGWAKLEATCAQQIDMNLHGQVSVNAGVKFLIAGAIIADPSGIISASIELYATLSAEGMLSFSFELSEYSRTTVGGGCELIWPFIPTNPTVNSDHYTNVAYSPKMTLDIGLKTGLELSGGFNLFGISIISPSIGGGLYLDATGSAESVGPIGYDTNIGPWGSASDWILYISVEAGVYAEIGIELLSFFDFPLYDNKWPFWQYENQKEF